MKRIFLTMLLVLFLTIIGCGEENPAETASSSTSGVEIKIEKVESVHGESFLGIPVVDICFYVLIINRRSDTITIYESDFAFQDIKGSFVHHDNDMVMLDPTVDKFSFGQIAYHLPSLRGGAPPKLILEPGQNASVGLFTSYNPDYQQGKLYLVYDDVKIPVQEKIDQAVWLDDPASATDATEQSGQEHTDPDPKLESEASDEPTCMEDVDWQIYFPLGVGNWKKTQHFVDGGLWETFIENITRILNFGGQDYYVVVKKSDREDHNSYAPRYYGYRNGVLIRAASIPSGPDDGHPIYHDFQFMGTEKITVPAGTFRCIKLKRHDFCVWLGNGVGFVKSEYDDGKTRLYLLADYEIK